MSAFHPFLTLPNKTLKREKGTFFSVWSDLFKSAKKVPFCGLERFLSKEQKRYLFCGYKQSHQKREKGTFKNKWRFNIKILLIDRCQATVGAPGKRYTDVFRWLYVPFLQSNFAVPNLIKISKTIQDCPRNTCMGGYSSVAPAI